MSRALAHSALLALCVLPIAACSKQAPMNVAPGQPAPTEHRLDPGAEKKLGPERKAWIEQMHRTAPDVDWRAINRENGEREMRRRNALMRTGGTAASTNAWSEVGSSNQAGRMHCAALGASQPVIYSGSDRGGVWRGTLAGTDWEPLSDNLYGGSNELVILTGDNPGDPDIIVSATDGGQIRVSRDDGQTWTSPTGLNGLSSIRGIAKLQDAAQTVLFYGRYGVGGAIYASTDKGLSFRKRFNEVVGWNGFLWVPRTGGAAASTLYLLYKQELRVSTDGGFNFISLATVDAAATSGYLTGSEAGAPTLYALVSVGGQQMLYRSTDAGGSFSLRSTIGNFWSPFCASINNPDLLLYGGVEAFRSTDGGASFLRVNTWGAYYNNPASKLHADLMGIYCLPDPILPSQERWYICTDGGIYESLDGVSSVNNLSLNGLGVSQYYGTHTSATNTDLILAGSQDQGYQRGSLQPPLGSGPSTPFNQLISGDYGHLTSSNGSHDLVYCTYPGFILVQIGQNNPSLVTTDFPSGSQHDWLPMVVADPLDSRAFFFCGDRLTRYLRGAGSTWNASQHSTQDFTIGGGNYLTAMAFAPTNPQRAYAVTNAALLFHTTDHGVNWTNSTGGAPYQHYFYGNAIAVHPGNELECVIGGSGYSADGVIRTIDGGQTWQGLAAGLPPTQIYDLAYGQDGSGDIYAATDAGAHRFVRVSEVWENIMVPGVPLTTYWSVEAVAGTGTIRFGTYGRGIWDYDSSACPGSINSYGQGCPGSGNIVPALVMSGCPSPGDAIRLTLTGALGGAHAILVLGQQTASIPLGPCTLLVGGMFPVQPVIPLGGAGPGAGGFDFPISLASTVALADLTLQAWIVDPGAPSGKCATNGVAFQIR